MPTTPAPTISAGCVAEGPRSAKVIPTTFLQPRSRREPASALTAVVYCEGNFGKVDGKTANGLVRHSEVYEIVAVIDSDKEGQDAAAVLGEAPAGVPVCGDLTKMLTVVESVPAYFILGIAPASGFLTARERGVVLSAIGLGMNIVNGLHEFLSEDPEFVDAAASAKIHLLDIRKPRERKNLRTFSGRIAKVTCPRIAVLGTDCAIGKRTTAMILTRALQDHGLKAVMIGTGQTGLIQGARYGVALDAIPSQFCAGELEALIIEAFEREAPDVIIIEGQGALSHPAYSTSSFILRGGCPQGVVLQHAPARTTRCDFDQMAMPTPSTEIDLIQTFSDTKVIGLALNHEGMTGDQVSAAIAAYALQLDIPVTDPLGRSPEPLVAMVLSAFPALRRRASPGSH